MSFEHPDTSSQALTTGIVPNFIDFLQNFASPEISAVNWIDRLRSSGWRFHFYGDDTWLRLFPDRFDKFEGVSSFYVNDFYTVDINVTRHLSPVLAASEEWDALILHYLGLDHIGHVEGPASRRMAPKLKEMDDVVETIHKYLKRHRPPEERWLIVVTGDHGMRDQGGHGGASRGETRTPLVLLSSWQWPQRSCSSPPELQQIDISAAVTFLAGQAPLQGFGVLPPQVSSLLSAKERLTAVSAALTVFTDSGSELSPDEEALVAEAKAKLRAAGNDATAAALLEAALRSARSRLMLASTAFDLPCLALGSVAMTTTALLALWRPSVSLSTAGLFTAVSLAGHFASCLTSAQPSCLCQLPYGLLAGAAWLVLWLLTLSKAGGICEIENEAKSFPMSAASWVANGVVALHAVSLASSSFIEEEHQTWYFLSASITSLVVLWAALCGRFLFRGIFLLIIDRFLRTMNQTGDKWSHLPDLSDWLLQTGHELWLASAAVASFWLLALLLLRQRRECGRGWTSNLQLCAALVAAAVFRLIASGTVPALRIGTITSGQFAFGLNLLTFLLEPPPRHPSEYFLLNLLLLCRLENLIVWALTLAKEGVVWSLVSDMEHCTGRVKFIVYHVCAMTTFFHLGNSNSPATIDVAAGYVGLSDFSVTCTGLLLTLNTFGGHFFWLSRLFERLTSPKGTSEAAAGALIATSWPMTVYFAVCVLLRHHLFVWTVFSPKLLYAGHLNLVILGIVVLALWKDSSASSFAKRRS